MVHRRVLRRTSVAAAALQSSHLDVSLRRSKNKFVGECTSSQQVVCRLPAMGAGGGGKHSQDARGRDRELLDTKGKVD